MENEVIRGIIAGVPMEDDTVGGGVTRNTVSAALGTNAGKELFKKSGLGLGRKVDLRSIEQSVEQKWDFGEGAVMEWYEDDEMVGQWEEASKEEEKFGKGKIKRKDPTS